MRIMIDKTLVESVECLATVALKMSDSDLERDWAWGAYDSEGIRFAFFRIYEELRELAVKTMVERGVNGTVPSSAHRILASYHGAYRDLQAASLGLDDAVAELVPADGEWSTRKTVAHVVDADVGFFGAVKFALDGHRSGKWQPVDIPDEAWDGFIGFDEAAFVELLQGPLSAIQSYHEDLHNRVLVQFAGIVEEELMMPSKYWENLEMSLEFRLHRFDSHMRQHIIQIDKILERIGRSPDEIKRLIRLIYGALAEAEGATIGDWDIDSKRRSSIAESIAARANEIEGILE